MTLTLHPRAAPPDRLRLWLGAFGRQPADLAWSVDGRPAQAQPLRPIAPAHRWDATTWTGIFELGGAAGPRIAPGSHHRVEVHETAAPARRAHLDLSSLPAEVPRELDRTFNVLLVSCFHRDEDKTGRLGRLVAGLPVHRRPHLSLLMGDQVYLDLPTIRNFGTSRSWLAQDFEAKYRDNWRGPGGYASVLDAAPSVAVPDDHEYWNNYPHRSPFIQNSWKESHRANWRAAADALFESFQLAAPAALGEPVEVDVPPLSFLLLDNRSQRQPDRSRSLASGALARVTAWVDRLIAEDRFGAVVTGQSLLDPAVGNLEGAVADRVLANYGDYRDLIDQLARLSEAGRPVLLLTGDVHWGRVVRIHRNGRTRFLEVISSPSALVTSVGADQLTSLKASLGNLFGGDRDPTFRHSEPDEPPAHFAHAVFGSRYTTTLHGRQKGDQVALLAFRRHGRGLELTVTYVPVPGTGGAPSTLEPLSLVPV
jgi:hypothetical protein